MNSGDNYLDIHRPFETVDSVVVTIVKVISGNQDPEQLSQRLVFLALSPA